MDFVFVQYYAAFVLAIFLCYGLGRIFWVPMLLDLAFDVALKLNWLSGWDIRLLIVVHGFAFFLWVLYLAGTFDRATFVAVLLFDLTLVFIEILPDLQAVGTGQEFWNETSTGILDVWLLSILVVVLSVVLRSTLVAKMKGRFVDILTNPKKRFLLPIGAWTAFLTLLNHLEPWVPTWLYDYRFMIGAQILVWGWVAVELPFYLAYRRLRKQYP